MRTIQIKKDEYVKLCCSGRTHYNTFNLFSINWLTYFKNLAIYQDADGNENELCELKVVE